MVPEARIICGHGKMKKEIVCEEIETELREQYPNILWVSAEMRGTRIIVRIRENTDKDIVTKIEEKEETAHRIVSEVTGTVQSMIVRKGIPQVLVGEEVTIGQVLVNGYYPVMDDGGNILRYEGVSADADLKIKTIENYTDVFSTEYEVKHYTKRKRLGLKVTIFEKTIELFPKTPFQMYETIAKKREMHLTENFYLPFTLETFWYLEYDSEIKDYSKEQLKAIAMERFTKKYENNLRKGVQIIEKDVSIDTNGKLCLVKGKVTLLVPQTYKIPVQIPKTETTASLEGDY